MIDTILGLLQVKLIDFGSASKTGTYCSQEISTFCYMAPETFRGIYNNSTDVFALGAIFYEMMSGFNLYDFAGLNGVVNKIQSKVGYNQILKKALNCGKIPNEMLTMFENILAFNPEARTIGFDMLKNNN